MSKMDWVPVNGWGVRQTVPAISQVDHPLMDPALANTAGVEGRFEETAGRYFVHRLVGLVSFDWVGTPSGGNVGLIQEVIWPGLIDDPNAGTVTSAGFINTSAGINARLWFHRVKNSRSTAAFTDIDNSSNRWYSHIDIRPNQVIDEGQIPLYSVYNDDGGSIDLDYRLWMRMLLTPLE